MTRGFGLSRRWFALSAVALGTSYGLLPLYSSNQNHRFLIGLARAGEGLLADDWLSSTVDPFPVFSAYITLVHRFLGDWVHYVVYYALFGAYTYGLMRIAEHVHPGRCRPSARDGRAPCAPGGAVRPAQRSDRLPRWHRPRAASVVADDALGRCGAGDLRARRVPGELVRDAAAARHRRRPRRSAWGSGAPGVQRSLDSFQLRADRRRARRRIHVSRAGAFWRRIPNLKSRIATPAAGYRSAGGRWSCAAAGAARRYRRRDAIRVRRHPMCRRPPLPSSCHTCRRRR